jgi:hypothetical protein
MANDAAEGIGMHEEISLFIGRSNIMEREGFELPAIGRSTTVAFEMRYSS